MDLANVQDLCQTAAGVRPGDAARLSQVGLCLDVLAELAGADLALLARAQEADRLLLLAQGRPTIVRSFHARPRSGEILPATAEPLVTRCLRTGRTQRGRYASVVAGRPVEQTVLPVRDAAGKVAAALSVERSLLNGPWSPPRPALRSAAEAASQHWTGGALAAQETLALLRMGRGLTLTEADGGVLHMDEAARELWQRAGLGGGALVRMLSGPPPQATVLARSEDGWGPTWDFDVGGRVFRRRDLRLAREAHDLLLTMIADVSHLHRGQWAVSTRSAAFQEIHHRVKNNLQTISSLLRMQARRESSGPARDSLRTAIGRVQSVAFVHEALSLDGAEEVDLKALASTLTEAALHDMPGGSDRITSAVLGPRLLIPAGRATQAALVLNEAIQNAVKHAFPEERSGSLTIRLEPGPEELTIIVQDDGVGLPEGFSLARSRTLGLQIARTIVESDLGGKLEVTGDAGARVTMRLPASLAYQEAESP
jgi:two-component sensor histidine kinase